MKKTLSGLIVALAATMLLTACCSNDSSCPVITADFTVDSFIDTDLSLETPVLSKEFRTSVIDLSKKCKPGFVYEAEMSCRLISDTTYLLGFLRNIESRMCCKITDLHLLGRINDSDLVIDREKMSECAEHNGYFVLFPEGVGCSYPWAAYVSDSPDDEKKQACDSTLYINGIPVFCYDGFWHPTRVG